MDKATELLEQLAAKLGTTVETLWPQCVGGVWVDALVTVVVLVLLAALLVCARRTALKKCVASDDDAGAVIVELVFGFLAVMFLIACADFGGEALAALMYPEGAALRELLKMVGGG